MLDAITTKLLEMAGDATQGPVNRAQLSLAASHVEYIKAQLESEIRRNAELQAENFQLAQKIVKHQSHANFVDIGPCFIKEDGESQRLTGLYCIQCKAPLMYSGLNNKYEYCCINTKCLMKVPRALVDTATR